MTNAVMVRRFVYLKLDQQMATASLGRLGRIGLIDLLLALATPALFASRHFGGGGGRGRVDAGHAGTMHGDPWAPHLSGMCSSNPARFSRSVLLSLHWHATFEGGNDYIFAG